MDAALEWRRRIFVGGGLVALVILGASQAMSGLISEKGDPDLLTAGLWVFSAVDLVVLSTVLFGPRQAARMRAAEGGDPAATGKAMSYMAVSLAATPTLIGFVLWMISGDLWRMYAFVPLSLAAGAVYWARIGSILGTLDAEIGPEPAS